MVTFYAAKLNSVCVRVYVRVGQKNPVSPVNINYRDIQTVQLSVKIQESLTLMPSRVLFHSILTKSHSLVNAADNVP